MCRPATSFDQALVKVRATTVFTTHTPVPAGHDMFPVWMMEKYFANFWPKLGLDRDQFMALASQQRVVGRSVQHVAAGDQSVGAHQRRQRAAR